MALPKFAIVVTTISRGDFLSGFCRQAVREGLRDRLSIIVIADKKSPAELFRNCKSLVDSGFKIYFPSLAEQKRYISRFGKIANIIPVNSDNRRNIGFLMALDEGCDILISVDDDNYCINGSSVFSEYSVVLGNKVTSPSASSSSGWFNACELLRIEQGFQIFPRGFPYNKRIRNVKVSYRQETAAVRLNTGLWLGEPDLDAITWLAQPFIQANNFKGKSVLLAKDTWAPINTQNTSLAREAVVSYYFIPMGYSIMGLAIDRFGDIFSGYFCQACVKHLGHGIRIGTPIVSHRRNAHNYLRDLTKELACIWMLEDLTDWLSQAKLHGDTYAAAYLSLADAIDVQAEHFKGFIWKTETRKYLHYIAKCMRLWVKVCERIG